MAGLLAELARELGTVRATVDGRAVVLRCLPAADQFVIERAVPRPEGGGGGGSGGDPLAVGEWVRTFQAAEVAVAMGHQPEGLPAWAFARQDAAGAGEWLRKAAAEVLEVLPVEVVEQLHDQLRVRAMGMMSLGDPDGGGGGGARALRELAARAADGASDVYGTFGALREHARLVHGLLMQQADRLEDAARVAQTVTGAAEKK